MREKVVDILHKYLKISKEEVDKLIEIPPQDEMGDYAFPCFSLASKMKSSPVKIASEIAVKLKLDNEIDKIEAKGPYLNFFVNKKILAEESLNEILKKKEKYGREDNKKKIVVDFSSPNIGKPMHIGHIRSTIIGDSILRIHDFLGYDVKGINYLGDIGLHIGKLIVAYELWLDKKALAKDPTGELLRLYVKFCDEEKTEYQEGVEEEFQDNEWTNKAKEKLRLIEIGDEKTHKIWKEIIKSSKEGFNRVYEMLNVNFHETTGQSLFSEKGKKIITKALEQGKAHPEGSTAYVELENLPKKYLFRSNGTASYITQDIGAAVERYKNYKFDKMIYITDFRQELHFKQLFAILKEFGYDFYDKLDYLGFGTINFGNEIIATRKGKIILLEDVLKKTIEKAKQETEKRKTKGDATDIGVGAIKYAILKTEPRKDVNFSWEQALNFEGNAGPYLQYSYARASSILKKAKNQGRFKIEKIEKEDSKLIKELVKFPSIVKEAQSHLNPALIANYSFELCQIFNEFYNNLKVIGSQEEAFRLKLLEAFRIVLKNSLYLLGIEVMDEM